MRVRLIIALVVSVFALAAWGVSANTSGPHSSGYHWIDNKEPGPTVEFEWIDITGTGTELDDLTDEDDAAQLVDIGFPFMYFGQTYNQVVVSSNGFLSFDLSDLGDTDKTDGCNDNYNWGREKEGYIGLPIPQTDEDCDSNDSGWGANPLIAIWFDDMDPGECGAMYYQTVSPTRQGAGRMFIVQWEDVCHNDCEPCEPGNGVTYEAVLFEGTNDIKMQYEDTFFSSVDKDIVEENFGGTATTGLDKDAVVGLQYHHATPALTEDLAVLYREGLPVLKGDTDCDKDVDSVDALWVLRDLAGLSVEAKCIEDAGNVDCDDDRDSVDALFILRHVAALAVTLPKGCTPIGAPA